MLAIYEAAYSSSHYVKIQIYFRRTGGENYLKDSKNNAMTSSYLTNYFHVYHIIRSFEVTEEGQGE